MFAGTPARVTSKNTVQGTEQKPTRFIPAHMLKLAEEAEREKNTSLEMG
jgi:hypothetical protein